MFLSIVTQKLYANELHKAVKSDDPKQVIKVLESGIDINSRDENNATALMYAVTDAPIEIVKLLIDRGADIEAKAEYGLTALYLASVLKNREAVSLLLEKGADTNVRLEKEAETKNRVVKQGGETPLLAASIVGNFEIVELLLKHGANVKTKSSKGQTPLQLASTLEVITILLQYGADTHGLDQEYLNSILHNFAQTDNAVGMKLLTSQKGNFDINARNEEGATPLIIAIKDNNIESVKSLLENNADPNMTDSAGTPPLMYVMKSSVDFPDEIFMLLLEHGADPTIKDKRGRTADDSARHIGGSVSTTLKRFATKGENFVNYVIANNYIKVKEELENHINPNARDRDGRTALNWAVHTGNIEMIKLLLKHNADLNALNGEGMSSLADALNSNKVNMIEFLVKEGAKLYPNNSDSPEKAFFEAVIFDNIDAVEKALKSGVNINSVDMYNNTALTYAINTNNTKMVDLLLKKGADFNIRGYHNISPLGIAKRNNISEIIGILEKLDKNNKDVIIPPEVYLHTASKDTLRRDMIRAVEKNDYFTVKALLEAGVDANAQFKYDSTLLQYSASFGYTPIVELLIEHGASVNSLSNSTSALILASRFGFLDTIEILLKYGANVNAVSSRHEYSALMAASVRSNKESLQVINLLIESGARVNQKDKDGNTALVYAVDRGLADVVKLLLENGADHNNLIHTARSVGVLELLLKYRANVDTRDSYGTRLHRAANSGKTEEVRLLLKYGADTSIKNNREQTALDLAKRKKHTEIVALLENPSLAGVTKETKDYAKLSKNETHLFFQYIMSGNNKKVIELLEGGVDPNLQDNEKNTPLLHAVKNKNIEMTKTLLEFGATPNTQNTFGDTPLIWASSNNSIEIVNLLLKHGAEVNKQNTNGSTALFWSVGNKQFEITKHLIEHGAHINLEYPSKAASLTWVKTSKWGDKEKRTDMLAITKNKKHTPYKEDGYTLLMLASNKGSKDIVELLLNNGADITLKNKNKQTALDIATQEGHPEIVALLKNPANIKGEVKATESLAISETKKIDKNSLSPELFAKAKEKNHDAVIKAVLNNNYDEVKKAIENGGKVNFQTTFGFTPLIVATIEGNKKIIELLLQNGAFVNAYDAGGFCFMEYTDETLPINGVKVFLEKKPDIGKAGLFPASSPIVCASTNGNLEIVKLLLEHGAKPFFRNEINDTALDAASWGGFLDIVKLLHKNGAVVDGQIKEGYSPLTRAVSGGHIDIVNYLIDNGANPNIKTPRGETLLDIAKAKKHSDIIALLEKANVSTAPNLINAVINSNIKEAKRALQEGIKINTPANLGLTPLMLASAIGNIEMVKLLLENKADPNIFDKGGYSFITAKHKDTNITKEILEQYIGKENTKDGVTYSTNSALRIASAEGHEEIVKLLLDKGAEVNAQNSAGFVALDAVGENTAIAKMLIEKGAKVNNQSYSGYTPLIAASQNGYIEVINLLLDNGAYLNIVAQNQTALSVAVYNGQTEAVKLLLSKEIDKNYLKENLSKLIETAEKKGYTEIVALLKNPDGAKTSEVKITEGLVAPEPKKPGTALIVAHSKDTMSLDTFTPDSKNDTLIKVLVKGASPVIAIRLENAGGKSGSWKTKDVKTSAMGIIQVENQGKVLNPNDTSFSVDVNTPVELDLLVQDNGALADKKTRIRVTLFHKDGSRTYALGTRISQEELAKRSSAKNEQPQPAVELKPSYRLSSEVMSGIIKISEVKNNTFNIFISTAEASRARWTCMYESTCEIDGKFFLCAQNDDSISGSFEGANILITVSPDSQMCGMGGTMKGVYAPQ